MTTTLGRAVSFEAPRWELLAAARGRLLELVVVTLQVPDELLHLH